MKPVEGGPRSRSQMFVTDLLFTGSVFALLFFLFAVSINDSLIQRTQQYDSMRARLYAEELASLLVLNPGVPFTWDQGGMVYPGGVDSPNEMDKAKIDRLMGMQLNQTFQLPYPTSLVLDQVVPAGYLSINCSQYLRAKYGNCTYTDEQIASRLLYLGTEVYRLQVVVDE